jgi:hypothetical protein
VLTTGRRRRGISERRGGLFIVVKHKIFKVALKEQVVLAQLCELSN